MDRDNSLPAQNRIISEYAERKELEITKWYSEAKSGYKGKRGEFHKMLEHLQDPKIEGVIFHKLDRSARNVGDFALLDRLMTQGKRIVIIEGEFDTTRAAGRLAFRNFCNLCVWYSENLSEEVSTKMEEVLMKGYFPAHAPIGYREGIKGVDDDPKRKYPDEKLAPFVKEAFELMSTGNYSIRTLAAYMRSRGMTNTKGSPVRKGNFENMLRNPFYHGLIQWKRREKTEEPRYYEGNHEPIIKKSIFDNVQAILDGRTQKSRTRRDHIYARLIKCQCGRFLVSSIHKDRVYLECHNDRCKFTSIRQDRLEDQIIVNLAKYEVSKDLVPMYEEAIERLTGNLREESDKMRKALNLRLGQIDKELDNLYKAVVRGILLEDEAISVKNDLLEQRHTLKGELALYEDKKEGALWKTTLDVVKVFRFIPYKYKQLNPLIKRRLLAFLFWNRQLQGATLQCEAVPAFDTFKYTNDFIRGNAKLSRAYQKALNSQPEGGVSHNVGLQAIQDSLKTPCFQSGGPRRPRMELSDSKVTIGFVERAVSNIKDYLASISLTQCEEFFNLISNSYS